MKFSIALSFMAMVALAFAGVVHAQADPVLNYKFNETTGDIAENSGSTGATNEGVFTSTPTWGSQAATGSGHVTINAPAAESMDTGFALTGDDPFTVEYWVRTTDARPQVISGMNPTSAGAFILFLWSDGVPGILATGAGGTLLFEGDFTDPRLWLNDGQWHHVAFTYDGTDFKLYVNGVEDQNASHNGNSTVLEGTNSEMVLFQNLIITNPAPTLPPFNRFVGDLDDFRFWTSVRTAQEIEDNYAIELGQITPEMRVVDPDGEPLGIGDDHRIDPIAPSATDVFEWEILNLHPTSGLNIGSIDITNVFGGSVTINSGLNPANTTIPAKGSATLGLNVTGNSGIGAITFDVSIANDDAKRNPFTFSVNGSRGMAGNFTISNAGGGGYLDFGDAFDDLNAYGVVGDVVFTVEDNGVGYTTNSSYALGARHNGTYLDAWQVRGSESHSIKFEAAAGVRPTISGTLVFDYIAINTGTAFVPPNGSMIFGGVHNVTLEGMRFTGDADSQVLVWQEDGEFDGSNIVLSRNVFEDNGRGMAVVAIGEARVLSFVLENSFIADQYIISSTWQYLAHFNGAVSMLNAGMNTRIEHNSILVTGNDADSAALSMAGGTFLLGSMKWNIFANIRPNQKVISLNSGAVFPNESDFNCFYYPNGVFSPQFVSLDNWRQGAVGLNLDGGSFVDDPEFLSMTAGAADLRLAPTSPCVDVAFGSTYTVDVFGTTRPKGPSRDIGAYESLGAQAGTISITTGTDALPAAIEGSNYNYAAVNATASNTSGTYNWSLSGHPAWLSISGSGLTGTFSGIPPAAASNVQFSVRVEDAAAPSVSATRTFTIQILASGTMVISEPASLPDGRVGDPYSATLKAIGGTGAHTWSIAAGPSWLSISGSTDEAVLSGTPDVAATDGVTIEIQVTDGTSNGSQVYNIKVERAPLQPPTGSGGGGGCSVGGSGGLWLVALAAIGGFALLRRRRRVTA